MSATQHWKSALPYYLRVSFQFSVIGWAVPLAGALIAAVWTALTEHRLVLSRTNVAFAIIFGGFFFLLALITAVGDDIHRNRGVQEATIEWNPSLVWKTFIYLGALFFFVAAFLAYHQGPWLSVMFVLFSIASAIAAKICF